jgi:hypothetical protein
VAFVCVAAACSPSGDAGSRGGIETRVGAVSQGPPDSAYKVADILLQQAAALTAPAVGRARAGAPASNAVVHVVPGGLEVSFHVGHRLSSSERAQLTALGAQIGEVAVDPRDKSTRLDAWIPAQQLMSLAALDFVATVTPPGYPAVNQVVTAISEGVATHRANRAQQNGVTGRGVVVGVTSNGTQTALVNSLAQSQGRGELPASCPVAGGVCTFGGATACVCDLAPGNGHEGTAMMEIVNDMAPGADLIFRSSPSLAGHVNALAAFVTDGANVITEDLAFDGEPAFQQGLAAAQVDVIALGGVPVHATAGNLGTGHTARVVAAGTGGGPDGVVFAATPPGCVNTPDNVVAIAPNGDTTFDATWTGGGVSIVLQWSEPRAISPTVGQGGFTDLNLYVMDAALTTCLLRSTQVQANGVGDTIEFVADAAAPANIIPAGTAVKVVVDVQGTSSAVAAPTLDLRFRGLTTPMDRTTAAGSMDPDSNYTSNRAPIVGASFDGTFLNGFSAQGPETLGLTTVCPGNTAGPCTGVAGPGLTSFPSIFWVARDTVSISGVGPFGGPVFPNSCPAPVATPQGQCLFGGTSASAPHSAACDALIRQLFGATMSPLQSNGRLGATATANLIDQNTNLLAAQTAQGSGLLDCYAALGPPSMTCTPLVTIPVNQACQGMADAAVLAAGSSDPEGGPLAFTLDQPGPFPPGVRLLTVTGRDSMNLTNTCTSTVRFVDSQAPVLGALPLQLCTLARATIVVQAPTTSDNCPTTLTGTILADATIPAPIPVTNGQTVTLPVGTHRIVWQLTDGSQTVTRTQTFVVSDPPARRLDNGDMLYSVTLTGRQAYVEAFVQQNGIQNVAGNIVSSEVANGDGTFTYSRVVPASRYRAGDVIHVRFYSYQSGRPGVFTPGPTDQIWFPDVIYGQNPGCPPAIPPGCDSARLIPTRAVASSQESSAFSASRAIDNSFSTRWSSAFRDPQWIYVDLGATRFVNRVTLFWERAASAEYEIQVSNDAVNWTTVFLETEGNGFTDQIDGLNALGRYVRVFSTERLTQWGNSLYEIQVFGDTDSACQ